MTGRFNVNPRKILRIARWEVDKSVGTVQRRTLLLAVVGVLVAGLAGPSLVSGDVNLEGGIYQVAVDEESPYFDPVDESEQFAIQSVDSEGWDLWIDDGRLQRRDSRKGKAAYAAFRRSILSYNDRQMEREVEGGGDEAAAFPVNVTLQYDSRAEVVRGGTGTGGGDGNAGGGGGGDGNAGGGGGGDGNPDGGGGTDGGDGGSAGGGDGGGNAGGGGGPVQVPGIGGGSGTRSGSPSSITPPFPFTSLVLGFVFMIPMNFVIQSYGSTIMDERINRRGELMLVSPVSPTDIVVGKTLPYFLVLFAVTTGIALGIGFVLGASAGPLAVAAVMPIAILFLAATFVGAMFARSFKELTFVTVTVSVFLTSYAFIPAIFTDVTPIALISPLTIVVRDLQGAGVSVGEFAFSVGPPLLTGVVLFALGAGVYREEDMFTQRPVHLKALDALAARIHRPRSVALWTALFIPFVLVAELLALALLWVLPVPVTVIGLLVCIAIVEEIAKSAHVFAGFEHARYDRSVRTALLVGTLSGLGFFLAEKALAVVQLVGIPSLRQGQGQPIFPAGSPGLDPLLVVALLLAPLALHTVTASLSALGARKSSRWWLAGMTAAVVVHVVYNYAVIGVIGGGV